MLQTTNVFKKFYGKLPGKIIPFKIKHKTYFDRYVFFSLDPIWWRSRYLKKK